jgi:hypothetical protein
MEKVGQEVEAIRLHKEQVEQLRKDTLHYHYRQLSQYYFATNYRVPTINSFKDNYQRVVEEIGRNSTYATTGLGSEVSRNSGWAFYKIEIRGKTADDQAERNSKIYKMRGKDGWAVNIMTTNGKLVDRHGRPFVPIA